ncbi:MAG: 50S ribosomal protein L15 [bacterium]|nr:50S ribosomal protein L15 [bacterium]
MSKQPKSNQLSPAAGSTKNRTRVGRGNASGHGGECGRGHKGQKSRSGYSRKAGFEGGQNPLYRRIPKNKGFKNFKFKVTYTAINLSLIDTLYKDNEIVDLDSLVDKGIVQENELLKILGDGELTKKVTIKANKASKTAVEKIQKAGATLEFVS